MNKAEAGRLGGLASKAKFSVPLFCPLCGQPKPLNQYQENGRKGGLIGGSKGGLTTSARHDHEHFVEIGKMGGRGNKKQNKERGIDYG